MADLRRTRQNCQDLAEGTSKDQEYAWEALALQQGLWQSCQAVVDAPSAEGVPWLASCFDFLQKEGAKVYLRRRFPANSLLLATAAARTAAAALVATLARMHGATHGVSALLHWARCAAAGRLVEELPASVALVGTEEADEIVRRCFNAIADSSRRDDARGAAQDAALSFLRPAEPRPSTQARDQCLRVPVLVTRRSEGMVAWLWLQNLPEAFEAFFQAPNEAFAPLGPELQDALRTAWDDVRTRLPEPAIVPHVRWWLTLDGSDGSIAIEGKSLQAVAEVGLTLLLQGRPYAGSCFITATVLNAQGQLGPVSGVMEPGAPKLQAALSRKEPNDEAVTVVVCRSCLPAETIRLVWKARGVHVVAAEDVSQACDHASGLLTQLRSCLGQLRDLPDCEPPPYLGNRSLAHLYLPPEIRKQRRPAGRLLKPYPPANPGEELAGSAAPLPPTVAAEAQDSGEGDLYGEPERSAEPLRKWQEEWRDNPPERAVVTAPPGQGKSLLVRIEASHLAEKGLKELDGLMVRLDSLPLPVVASLRDLIAQPVPRGENPEGAVRAALAAVLRESGRCSNDVAAYLSRHAHEARTTLFLDGLDEIDEEGDALPRLLNVLRGWSCRVLITSRPHRCEEESFPFDVTEYRLAPLTRDGTMDFVRRWFPDAERQERMLQLLQRSPSLRQVAQSPFLLTLLCWVGERRPFTADVSRAHLYERMIRDLLGLSPSPAARINERRAAEWLPVLTEIALASFLEGVGRRALSQDRLLSLLGKSLYSPLPQGPTQQKQWQCAGPLLDELERKRILVPEDPGRTRYFLPHRSILEYLAARGIADLIEGQRSSLVGREGSRSFEIRIESVWAFLDQKAWDPNWEQILRFIAGSLEDPRPLIKRLLDAEVDDLFRHRLALAGECLSEIHGPRREGIADLRDDVTREIVLLYWQHLQQGTSEAIPHIGRALRVLRWAGGRVPWGDQPPSSGSPVSKALATIDDYLLALIAGPSETNSRLAWRAVEDLGSDSASTEFVLRLAELLRSDRGEVRLAAAKALRGLGRTAAVPEVVSNLEPLLRAEELPLREAGVWLVSAVGPAAATPEVRNALADLLEQPEATLWTAVLESMGSLGAAPASKELLLPLLALLHDTNPKRRAVAAAAVGRTCPATLAKEILPDLEELLDDSDWQVQSEAAKAIGGFGEAVATALFFARLIGRLREANSDGRRAAVEVVRGLGSAAATFRFLDGLFELIEDGEEESRRTALQALGALGPAAAKPFVLSRLPPLLSSLDVERRRAGAEAVAALGPAAHSVDVVASLLKLLGGTDAKGREAAVAALSSLGSVAATPECLACLIDMLEKPIADQQLAAALAVAGLGPAAAEPLLVAALASRMDDSSPSVRRAAAQAVGALGRSAGTTAVRKGLARLLVGEDQRVSQAAAEAVRVLGRSAFSPDVVAGLLHLLHSPHKESRRTAAEALGSLGDGVAAMVQPHLAELFRTSAGPSLQRAAAEAVGCLGQAAVTPEILTGLVDLLHLGDWASCWTAAFAAASLGPAASSELLTDLAEMLHSSVPQRRRLAARTWRKLLVERVRCFLRSDKKLSVKSVADLSAWIPEEGKSFSGS